MQFKTELQQRTNEVQAIVEAYLPKETGHQKTIFESMNYSVMVGGKRLRPLLMQETYRLFGGKGREVEPFMAAMEMIHTYSLVHDDLPAMDNDEYRRGRKTTHVVYGEDLAILAGDALLNYAFETIAEGMEKHPSDAGMVKAFRIFSKKAGIFGMVGGQSVDVINENNNANMNLDDILFIHENKTAALIECALMCGAALAGANDEQISQMEKVGSNIGLAYQIQDDILDATGSFEELGKPIGSDAKNQKATYLSLQGMEKSAADVKRLSEEAVTILGQMPNRNLFLEDLVMSLVERRS